jgi:peptidoglycan/xylan/chitin deacetylase (PgdA/CDA1 family)
MNRTLILMYHFIDQPRSDKEARFCCAPQRFARQMCYLKESNYTVISLDKLIECIDGRATLPENGVVVTFDDGCKSNYLNALPVLLRYKIPATMFIVSDRIDGSNDWMHPRGFPHREILSKPQLMELKHAGISLGSHARTHPRLTQLKDEAIKDEVGTSKQILEDMLGTTISYFAYPFGLYNQMVKDAVEAAGYQAACSTRSGFNRSGVDRFALRRIEIYGSDSLWKFRQKLKFGTNEMRLLFPVRYYATRLGSRIGF